MRLVMKPGRAALYTDGTPVQEGDSIRYHQQPGGLMAHGPWRYGIAQPAPADSGWREMAERSNWLDPDELFLYDPTTDRRYGIVGHVIERAPTEQPRCPVHIMPGMRCDSRQGHDGPHTNGED